MKNVIGTIFIFFGIMTLFTSSPMWDAVLNIAVGYLFLDKEEK